MTSYGIRMCSPSEAARVTTTMHIPKEFSICVLALSQASSHYKLLPIPPEMIRDGNREYASSSRKRWTEADHTHLIWLIEYTKKLADEGDGIWNYTASDMYTAFYYWLAVNKDRLALFEKENCPVPIEEQDGFPFYWNESTLH